MSVAAVGVLVLVALVRFEILSWHWLPVAGLAMVIHGVFSIGVLPQLRWLRWRYEVHDTEIDLMYGLIMKTRVLIPMARVQHVDTNAGPLMRALGLASITIATAGGNHAVPALSNEVAAELRDLIAASAGAIEDVV